MTTREHVACCCGSTAPADPALAAVWRDHHRPESQYGETGTHYPASRKAARYARHRKRLERAAREASA